MFFTKGDSSESSTSEDSSDDDDDYYRRHPWKDAPPTITPLPTIQPTIQPTPRQVRCSQTKLISAKHFLRI